ncbi:hypothetical protein [Roseiconus lacunae]|uniref:Uncharacterized protein n=1 Tax=Roseiconus lacunae TaxID=2605694 RepID=A0ABT7PHG4_9BACT|nr:hypothetical protein [Roseiconus lacunae]MDM4015944.1 hypothetical protein [Roseiconus lacunae]
MPHFRTPAEAQAWAHDQTAPLAAAAVRLRMIHERPTHLINPATGTVEQIDDGIPAAVRETLAKLAELIADINRRAVEQLATMPPPPPNPRREINSLLIGEMFRRREEGGGAEEEPITPRRGWAVPRGSSRSG